MPIHAFVTRTFLIICLIINGLITSFAYADQPSSPADPIIKAGFVDLSHWSFKSQGVFDLSGAYHFYWQQLLTPEQIQAQGTANNTLQTVPSDWSNFTGHAVPFFNQSFGKPIFGYGTYHLKIKLPHGLKQELSMYIPPIAPAYTVYINNKIALQTGQPGESADSAHSMSAESITITIPPADEIDLVIQVSNFSAQTGGIMTAPKIGFHGQIYKNINNAIIINMLIIGSTLIFGIYHIALYSFRPVQIHDLIFGFMILVVALRLFSNADHVFILNIMPVDTVIEELKLNVISYYLLVPLMAAFYSTYYRAFTAITKKIVISFSLLCSLPSIISALLSSEHHVTYMVFYFSICTLAMIVYSMLDVIKLAQQKAPYTAPRLITTLSILLICIHDIASSTTALYNMDSMQIYGWGIYILAQALIMASTFVKAFETIDEQRTTLIATNQKYKQEINQRRSAEEKRIKLESELNKARKLETLGQIAGAVAHDLNNLLSKIINYPELLLMNKNIDKSVAMPLKEIRTSGMQIAAIVQDLLTMARRNVAQLEVTDINGIVEQYVQSPEFAAQSEHHPNIKVHKDTQQANLYANISPLHLNKSLMNLTNNAFESIDGTGQIEISTNHVELSHDHYGYDTIPKGAYVVINIKDTGSGISAKDLPNLFEPFYTRKEMGNSGTGLGLAIVAGTLKDVHGFIDIKTSSGKGSCFSLYIPSCNKSEHIHKRKNIAYRHGQQQHILVVDDIPNQRDMSLVILKQLGYYGTTVATPEAAIEYVKNHPVEAVILDMVLESKDGRDGLDTFIAIREINPDIIVIIASGYAETDRVKTALRLGAFQFIAKPYPVDTLGRALDNAFRHNKKSG